MKKLKIITILTVSLCTSMVSACGASSAASISSVAASGSSSDEHRTTITDFPVPEASGTEVYGDDTVSIDASNTDEGYVCIRYLGDAGKVKVQITDPADETYTYNLAVGEYETFPFSSGDGTYSIAVLTQAYDDMYAMAFSQDVSVQLNDEFRPFLYPNQYIWYTQGDDATKFGQDISGESSDDLNYVENVYNYVIENITYDNDLAANIQTDYIPDVNATLASGKGICFDYASLMSALLRSQGVPTKLVVGYSGTAYHAWISVYLEETGWVDDIIEFNGTDWSLMDPTLGANNDSKAVAKYVGDGSNYTAKYFY